MKPFTKIVFLTTCFCIAFASSILADNYKYEAKKTITRSFAANSNSTLDVDNKYGNIEVKQWDKNEIAFEIIITVGADKLQDAEAILEITNVKFSETGNTVSAATELGDMASIGFKRGCDCSRQINYTIMVPKGINYKLTQSYGNIVMPQVNGNTNIAVKYGNLNIEGASGGQNTIDIKYGGLTAGDIAGSSNSIELGYSNATIKNLIGSTKNIVNAKYCGKFNVEKASNLNIEVKYSIFNTQTVDKLNIESGYSNITIGKVQKIHLSSRYDGRYTIAEADEVNGEFGYTNFRMGKLNKSLLIRELRYGKLLIDNVSADFENIGVDAGYTNIDIHFDPKTSYNVDAYTKYGNIDIREGNFKQVVNERNSIQMKGTVGKSSAPKANVKIATSYANIKLSQ